MTNMTNTSTTASSPSRRKGWLPWVIGATILAVLIAVVVGAAVMLRTNSEVPADLDYSTTRLSTAGLYRASFTVSESAIPVNRLHTWTLHVETPDGQPIDDATVSVDGDMPQHGHGMPTRPQVRPLGNGDYLVEGMKFQMGGWWVMGFDITANGQTDRVSFNLMLK